MEATAMPSMWSVNWHSIFVPSGSLPELVVRGSLMYLLILAALRVFRRDSGSMAMSDLLVIVLIADAAQSGMAGEYRSLTEGVVLVATIFAWNYVLDWLAYKSRFMSWLLHPPPLLLIHHGRINQRNLRAQMITREDLREQLREQGIDDIAAVKSCWLESDGQVSVIRTNDTTDSPPPRRRRRR